MTSNSTSSIPWVPNQVNGAKPYYSIDVFILSNLVLFVLFDTLEGGEQGEKMRNIGVRYISFVCSAMR